MNIALDNYGFGTKWKDVHTGSYEGFTPQMSDYHMHGYYEISLILSGNVHVLLSDRAYSGSQVRLVLLRPGTPHYIYCEPDQLYSRRNLCFCPDFLADCPPQWQKLLQVFDCSGAVLELKEKQWQSYLEMYQRMDGETDTVRKKLLLLYILSLISELLPEKEQMSYVPEYVTKALTLISTGYGSQILAAELADAVGVGRTTLMTGFKKYVGMTVNAYLTRCRLQHAVDMLQYGRTEQEVAASCGFTDASNMIRCFKKCFGMPPRQYLESLRKSSA